MNPRPHSFQQTDTLFDYAARERDLGIARAEDHADRVEPGWPEMARAFLEEFARSHEFFISEDVSSASKDAGLPQPPTDRAWGGAYRHAQRNQIIAMDGTGRSTRRNASLCPRWRSLVFQRGS